MCTGGRGIMLGGRVNYFILVIYFELEKFMVALSTLKCLSHGVKNVKRWFYPFKDPYLRGTNVFKYKLNEIKYIYQLIISSTFYCYNRYSYTVFSLINILKILTKILKIHRTFLYKAMKTSLCWLHEFQPLEKINKTIAIQSSILAIPLSNHSRFSVLCNLHNQTSLAVYRWTPLIKFWGKN